uniref:SGNH hydrolase-type esterase domain-containing protein n=1 Tax=Romanomermis culicivorax TaxID=13658 RepID=A0A915J6B7_ROMCU
MRTSFNEVADNILKDKSIVVYRGRESLPRNMECNRILSLFYPTPIWMDGFHKVAEIGRAIVRRRNAKVPSIIVFDASQKFTPRSIFEQDGLHLSRRGKRHFEMFLTSALDSLQ